MSTSEAIEAAGDALDAQLWENDYALSQYDYGDRRRKPILQAIAARVVAAHDAARWRVPTAEDWESDNTLLILPWSRRSERWISQREGVLRWSCNRGVDIVRVADPLPLPELPG